MAEQIKANLKQLAQSQRMQGDLDGAAQTLRQAIQRAGVELADLHGALGGTLREQGNLPAAIAEYDAGFTIDSHYGIASSYNALNRLVSRIMLVPGALTDPELLRSEVGFEFVDVRQALLQLQAQLQRYVEADESNNFWAAGDLAITAALNGDSGAAANAIKRFVACLPPPFARNAYRQTVAGLVRRDKRLGDHFAPVEAALAAADA